LFFVLCRSALCGVALQAKHLALTRCYVWLSCSVLSALSCSKMKDMQLQILSHCYNEQNLRALTRISQHQQQMEQELQDTLKQVSAEFVLNITAALLAQRSLGALKQLQRCVIRHRRQQQLWY
jgi:hypothetical protein